MTSPVMNSNGSPLCSSVGALAPLLATLKMPVLPSGSVAAKKMVVPSGLSTASVGEVKPLLVTWVTWVGPAEPLELDEDEDVAVPPETVPELLDVPLPLPLPVLLELMLPLLL